MPAVSVVLWGSSPGSETRRQVVLVREDGLTVYLPITSAKVEHTNLAGNWVEVERPGQNPIMRYRGYTARRMRMTAIFADPDGRPMDEQYGRLIRLAREPAGPMVVRYGPGEHSWWRLTDLTIISEKRAPGTNAVVRAEAQMVFTRHFPDHSRPSAVQQPRAL